MVEPNWLSPPIVNVDLIRVASKISLAIRKRTVVEADLFTIQKVELINLPADSYLLPGRAYGGVLHSKNTIQRCRDCILNQW